MQSYSRKYYYYRRPIGDLSETRWRSTCLIGHPLENSTCFIGDWHGGSETHRRPRNVSSETGMSNRRSIGDQHAWCETHGRPLFLIGDPLETYMPDWRPIRDLDMLHWRPIWNRHTPSETHLKPTCPIGDQHTCLIGDTLETDMPDLSRD